MARPNRQPLDQDRNVIFSVSSVDGSTPTPLEVNPATGQLLVSATGGGGGTQYTDGATAVTHPVGTQEVFTNGSGIVTAVSTTNPLPIAGTFSSTPTPDSTPPTQTITTQDIVTTSNAGANGQLIYTGTPTAGSTAMFTFTSAWQTAYVQATGTWTGTVTIEGTVDGTNWFGKAVKQIGSNYIIGSYTANFDGAVNISDLTAIRVRATQPMTGTATVLVRLSINGHSVYVVNGLTLKDSTIQSITSTIKAASTAPLASDTALVVTESPNSPSLTSLSTIATNTTGVSTAANQVTMNNNLSTIVTNTGNGATSANQSTEITNLSAINTSTAKIPSQGQAAMAASTPVVIASNQSTIPVSLATNTPILQSGSTTAVTQPTGTNLHTVVDSGTLTAVTAITNALPAGTNLLGKTGIDQTTVGTTNGVSIAQIGSTTVVTGGVAGTLAVGGVTASGATATGSPVRVGGLAKTTNPTAVTDGQVSSILTDKLGKQVVVGSIRDLKGSQRTVITSSTAETTIVTAIALTFIDIYRIVLANSSATACNVDIRNATAGTIIDTITVPAGSTAGWSGPESAAANQTTVNNNWTATCSASITSMTITAYYVKNI